MANNPPAVHAELSRDLNLFHVTMMGLGMMIGAGVFVGIGLCMGTAGPGGLMLTFALNGLIALFSAMSFAELASAIPRAGGTYNFARIAFGRPASFIAGWTEWLAASAAGGFYALVLSKYTLEFMAGMAWIEQPQLWLVRLCAVAAALTFVYINFRGSSETGKLGAVFTVGQMAFVVAIGLIGAFQFFNEPSRIENFQPFLGDGSWLKLLGSMGIIYVAFEGFEVIAQAGDETIEPRKNIPKAILYSVLIVTLTYLLVGFGTIVAVKAGTKTPQGEVIDPVWRWIGSQGPMGFRGAVDVLLRGWGGLLVTLAVIFSATSALNATIFSATRTSYALGRDRMLPGFFANIHQKTRTPWIALMVTGVLVMGIILTVSIKDGSATASILFLLLFFLVNLCVIRVRRHMGDELEYGFLMPLFPVFPILAIVLQLGLAFGILEESWMAWLIAGLWLLAGVVVFLAYSRRNTVVTEDEIHVFHDAQATSLARATAVHPSEEYRIMVAVANPDSALQLVQNTYKICGAKNNPSVELIHMVPVPDQVPLADAEQYMSAGREAIMETMLYLGPRYPINSTLRYCRNCARGIVSAIRQKRVNMLIMGWHGLHVQGFHLGSTVDPVLETAPCDVVMLKNCGGNKRYKKILVPLAGGPNSAMALEMAGILADPDEGEVTAFTVASRQGKFDLAGFVAQHRSRISLPDERVHCKTVSGHDVVEAILNHAENFDMVVLGNTNETNLSKVTHTPIPETIAHYCEKPVVMCRAASGLQSWLRRFI